MVANKKGRVMKTNEILREQIFQIITNQLRANNPPETKQTYERLKKLGYDMITRPDY
jgi:hypothetical protein